MEKSVGQKKVMVIIPYMKAVSETVECMLRRYGIAIVVRPHKTLHQLLAHPKDNRSLQKSGVVYSIPCKDYPMVYIAETGRRFEMRERAHKKDVKQLEGVKYTRRRRKESLMNIHQSVLTDHVASKNYTIDCEGVRLKAKEPDWKNLNEIGNELHVLLLCPFMIMKGVFF